MLFVRVYLTSLFPAFSRCCRIRNTQNSYSDSSWFPNLPSSKIVLVVFLLLAIPCLAQLGPAGTYSYGRAVVIDHSKVATTDQTDFPVLISGSFPYLATTANGGQVQNSNGYDIVFTSDVGGQNQLDHEIDTYSPATGTASFWVRVPVLSHTLDTTIYMWYGSGTVQTSQENKPGVWRNGYAAVWHLGNGTTVNALDSTGVNNGTVFGVSPSTASKIGGSALFSGAGNSYIFVPNSPQIKPTSALTLEGWIYPTASRSWDKIFNLDYNANGSWSPPYGAYIFSFQGATTQLWFQVVKPGAAGVAVGSTQSAPLSQWTHVAGTYDGSALRVFMNGNVDPATPAAVTGPISYGTSQGLTIARDSNYESSYTEGLSGGMDELRISSLARSAGWITTEYNNQNSPSSFFVMCPSSVGGSQPTACGIQVPASSFAYVRPVLLNHYQVPNADQTDFPVLISGIFPYLATTTNGGQVQNSNGYDVVFTSDAAGQNRLDHEIDTYSPTTGAASFWVRIPTLSHTAETEIYMWYGSSVVQASQENKPGVWRNGYAAVWHLGNGTAVNALDSTGVNNAAVFTVPASGGKVGGAASFSGAANSYISVPNTPSIKPTNALTLEGWLYPTGTRSWNKILNLDYNANGSWSPPYGAYDLSFVGAGSQVYFQIVQPTGVAAGISSVQSAPLSQWTHVASTYDGTALHLYLNGKADPPAPTVASGAITYGTSQALTIGKDSTYEGGYIEGWTGQLDELRISSVARSADWVAAEYNNQNVPSSFAYICAASASGSQPPPCSLPQPTLTALSPAIAPTGTTVTISGSGFGASRGTSTVTFNGVAPSVVSWSDTQISVQVATGTTTGPVVVTVGGVPGNSLIFTVPNPRITGVSPSYGLSGQTVTVTGSGFLSGGVSPTAAVGNSAATVSNVTDSQFNLTVPPGDPTGKIMVNAGGVNTSSASNFGPCASGNEANSCPCVTHFDIAGSVVGGNSVNQAATGTVQVNKPARVSINQNDQNGSGYYINYDCAPGTFSDGGGQDWSGCSSAGSDWFNVGLHGPNIVPADRWVAINVHAYTCPDPGKTAQFLVKQLTVSLSAMPTVLRLGSSDQATGTMSFNAPASYAVSLSASPAGIIQFPTTVYTNGQQSTTFAITPNTVQQPTNVTLTASFNNSTSTASLQVWPGENEMGHCPECEATASQPVNLMNGNVWITHSDYSLPGLGGGISLQRTWNSLWDGSVNVQQAGLFGDSWRSTYEERIQVTDLNHLRYWRSDGSAWLFSYDGSSWVLQSPLNQHVNLSFDSTTALYTLLNLDGSSRTFNNSGYLTVIRDRNGNSTAISYDSSNRITQVTDAAGRVLTFNYASPSAMQVQSIQDVTGVIASYGYDSSARLLSVGYADSSSINYNYGANSLIGSVTDQSAKVLEAHTYDGSRRGLTSQQANGVGAVTVAYTASGSTQLTDSLANVTNYSYTTVGNRRVTTAVSGPGCSTCGGRGVQSYTYDASGNRISNTDPNGVLSTYSYDNNGNVTLRGRQLDATHTQSWQYTYNIYGEVLTATDPLGHATTNTYDAHGNLLTTTTPSPGGTTSGSTTTFTYDTKGQLLTITDPLNHVSTLTYTTAGLLQTVTDAQNHVTTYGYDARQPHVGDGCGAKSDDVYLRQPEPADEDHLSGSDDHAVWLRSARPKNKCDRPKQPRHQLRIRRRRPAGERHRRADAHAWSDPVCV